MSLILIIEGMGYSYLRSALEISYIVIMVDFRNINLWGITQLYEYTTP